MAEWQRKPGFDLTGMRALVVGCSNPSGRAIALALAEAGADIAVASATMDAEEVMEAKRVAKTVAATGRKSFSQGWDVTLPTNVQVGLKQIIKEFGTPNILVFNADMPLAKPIEKVSDAEFAKVQQVNLNGAFYSARSFVREFGEQQLPGRIIFVSNIFAERGIDNMSAYSAAKAGLNGLMLSLSQELGARNFTVNAISTGWMDYTPGRGPDEVGQNLLMRFVPMRRFGRGEEVGALSVLLCSQASGYINGQLLHVDGGVLTHL
jgi:3-oxoacyl-[acyl-carrier protein] reductase